MDHLVRGYQPCFVVRCGVLVYKGVGSMQYVRYWMHPPPRPTHSVALTPTTRTPGRYLVAMGYLVTPTPSKCRTCLAVRRLELCSLSFPSRLLMC